MQDNLYYKPGGNPAQAYPARDSFADSGAPAGFAENSGILGGMDWMGGSASPDGALSQDAMDNTAVGRISIPE